MPAGLMDGIKSFLDYIERVDNVDFRLVHLILSCD